MQRQGNLLTAVSLEIACVRIDLRLSGAPEVAGRFGAFAGAAGPAAWRIVVRPSRAPRPDGLSRRLVAEGARWRIDGGEELGWLDATSRRGEVLSDPAAVALEPFLRAALASDVAARGGCLFHAAAVTVDGLAHLVPGRSGAGKTTFAALARDRLADEISVVLPGTGGFRVHGSPWWSGRPGSAPLGGVHALAWDGEGTAPLGKAEALRHLASSLVAPVGGAAELGRALGVAARVAAAVPSSRLSFRRDSDVDALLRGAAARAA